MKKRGISLALALLLALSLVPMASAAPIDSADEWARSGIADAVGKGFVPDDIQDNYRNNITRQEFCRLAVGWMEYALGMGIDAILRENEVSRDPNAFSDTSNPTILAAYALGILSGEVAPSPGAPGRFNPGGTFTRQQAAVMVMNTCGAIGGNTGDFPACDFSDLYQADNWARPGINYVRYLGIMSGVSQTQPVFSPFGTFTRQESILLFNNIDIEAVLSASPPDSSLIALPGAGGEVFVRGQTRYSFTPDRSGIWQFITSDNSGDPYLELYGQDGEIIAYDDDGAVGLNSLIVINLDAGSTYVLDAGFYGVGTGSYTLSVSMAQNVRIGENSISGAGTHIFTPDRTGLWSFQTSNSVGDPYIFLNELDGRMIGYDDDSGGGLESLLVLPLTAGTPYRVSISYYERLGSSTLTISFVNAVALPTAGGSVRVNNFTAYSFTPNRTALWEFSTQNNTGYPYIIIHDSTGRIISDFSEGSGYATAYGAAYLEAGETYYVIVGFYETLGDCTLSISVAANLPPSGGNTSIGGTITYSFTPNRSGIWTFQTSGENDPYILIVDSDEWFVGYDDDSGDDFNAFLNVPLIVGETYFVHVGYYSEATGCTLSVSSVPAVPMNGEGGSFRVNNATVYTFAPNQSGTWEFATHDNYGDPCLWIYDAGGSLIEENDDYENDLNSFISISLNAGTTYTIIAGFYSNSHGSYTLRVSRVP